VENAVIVVVDDGAVIDVHPDRGPRRDLEDDGGQRGQSVAFVAFEPFIAGTLEFLERLGIELGEQRTHRVIEGAAAEEALLTQDREDLAFWDLNPGLNLGLVAPLFDARRGDHRGVMLGHPLPEQLRGDALAAELLVDGGPIRGPLVGGWTCGRLAGRGGQKPFLELDLAQFVGQRPGDLRRRGASEMIPHGADGRPQQRSISRTEG